MDIVLCNAKQEQLELLFEMNLALMADERYDRPPAKEELKKRWQSFLFEERFLVTLFMENEQIAGYAVVHKDEKPPYIRHFYIKEEFRGQGIGRTAFELLLKELDTDEVDLDVMAWNEGGVAFWNSLGFKERCIGLHFKREKR